MNDEKLILTGQGEQENIPSHVDTSVANKILAADNGTENTVGSMSHQIKNMITSPGFASDNGIYTTNEIAFRRNIDPIQRMSAEMMARGERGDIVSLDLKSDTGTIVADSVIAYAVGLSMLGDKALISLGGLVSKVTGNELGVEMRDRAYDVLESKMRIQRYAYRHQADAESLAAQITMGAASMLEMMAMGAMTGGVAPIVEMSVDVFGSGTYNNMKKYAQEHDGSIEGYEGNWAEIGIDLLNAAAQAIIEKKFGVGSARFLKGVAGSFIREGIEGFMQEASQEFLSDLGEVLKENEEANILWQNWHNYLLAGAIGGVLQGALGAATHKGSRLRADAAATQLYESVDQRLNPEKDAGQRHREARDFAKSVNDRMEQGLTVDMVDELSARVDANNNRGAVRDNLVEQLTKARMAQLGVDSVEELDADDLSDIQDVATIWTRESVIEAWAKGIPIMETSGAVMRAEGASLVFPERGAPQSTRTTIAEDAAALGEQIASGAEQAATAREKAQSRELTQEAKERAQTQAEQEKAESARIKQKVEDDILAGKIAEGAEKARSTREAKQSKALTQEADARRRDAERALRDFEKGRRVRAEKPRRRIIAKANIRRRERELAGKEVEEKAPDADSMQEEKKVELTDGELSNYSDVKNSTLDSIETRQKELRNRYERLRSIPEDGATDVQKAEVDQFLSLPETNSVFVVEYIFDDGKQYQFLKLSNRGNLTRVNKYDDKNYWSRTVAFEDVGRIRDLRDLQGVISQNVYEIPVQSFEQRANELMARDYPGQDFDVLYQQSLKSAATGAVTDTGRGSYDPRYQRIMLNKNADISTILHELAHMNLNSYFKAARSGNAPKEFLKQWDKVERALGIRPYDRFLDKDISEKFARGFEKWVMDGGKGASDALKPVYGRLSVKIADIYDELATRYFDMVSGLKPEVLNWYAKNDIIADKIVGEIPEDEEPDVSQREKDRQTARKEAERDRKAEGTAKEQQEVLSDAVEEAAAKSEIPVSEEGETDGKTRERKSSIRLREMASARNILVDARSEYKPDVTMEMAQKYADMAAADFNKVMDIALGKEDGDATLAYIAARNFALEDGNVAALNQLQGSQGQRNLTAAGKELAKARVYPSAQAMNDTMMEIDRANRRYENAMTEKNKREVESQVKKLESLLDKYDLKSEAELDKILKQLECK